MMTDSISPRKRDSHIPSGARKLHIMVRASARGDAGSAICFGLKVGFWPCLQAPFIQFAFHRWILEVWFGLPSYRFKGRPQKRVLKPRGGQT
jgi:hypothetical protein